MVFWHSELNIHLILSVPPESKKRDLKFIIYSPFVSQNRSVKERADLIFCPIEYLPFLLMRLFHPVFLLLHFYVWGRLLRNAEIIFQVSSCFWDGASTFWVVVDIQK